MGIQNHKLDNALAFIKIITCAWFLAFIKNIISFMIFCFY
jgi:hypothetical protein